MVVARRDGRMLAGGPLDATLTPATPSAFRDSDTHSARTGGRLSVSHQRSAATWRPALPGSRTGWACGAGLVALGCHHLAVRAPGVRARRRPRPRDPPKPARPDRASRRKTGRPPMTAPPDPPAARPARAGGLLRRPAGPGTAAPRRESDATRSSGAEAVAAHSAPDALAQPTATLGGPDAGHAVRGPWCGSQDGPRPPFQAAATAGRRQASRPFRDA